MIQQSWGPSTPPPSERSTRASDAGAAENASTTISNNSARLGWPIHYPTDTISVSTGVKVRRKRVGPRPSLSELPAYTTDHPIRFKLEIGNWRRKQPD